MQNSGKIVTQYLWVLQIGYCIILVMANWFDARLIQIGPFITDAGTIIFPLTYLFSDILTEVYGYKRSRQVIWLGYLLNLIFLAYGQLIVHLPGPADATQNLAFDTVLKANGWVMLASFCSYIIAEPLNALFLAKLKIWCQGKWMAGRFMLSTVLAAGIDSVVFGYIAFGVSQDFSNLKVLILTMWFVKIVIELICVPFSVLLSRKLKRVEQLDIYDDKTRFAIWRWESSYSQQANRY